MRFSCLQVFWSYVDNVTADSLSRVESQCQVLMYLVDVQLATVQRSLIYGARLGAVHHLAVTCGRDKANVNYTIQAERFYL